MGKVELWPAWLCGAVVADMGGAVPFHGRSWSFGSKQCSSGLLRCSCEMEGRVMRRYFDRADQVMQDLRFGTKADWELANKICCHNKKYAEPSGLPVMERHEEGWVHDGCAQATSTTQTSTCSGSSGPRRNITPSM